MAEVFGQIGGEPVELNNAATELTLNKLLAINTRMADKLGVKTDYQLKQIKNTEKELKRLAVESKKYYQQLVKKQKIEKDNLKIVKEQADVYEKQTKNLKQVSLVAGKVAGVLTQTITKLNSFSSSIANMGNSITAATNALSHIPVVGGVLSGTLGLIANAAEKTQKSFQQTASVGANFNGSLDLMIKNASAAGLTIDQLAGIISKNGESFALLESSSIRSADRLARLGESIRRSDLQNQLANLGYNSEDINEALLKFNATVMRSGRNQQMSDEQLIASTGEYLKNLDAVSKLTGESKKSLQAQQDALMADSQYRVALSKQSVTGQRELQAFMQTTHKFHSDGIKEILATGTATSKSGETILNFMPSLARELQQLHATGAEITPDISERLNRIYQDEARSLSKNPLSDTLGLYVREYNDFIVGTLDVASRTKTLEEARREVAESSLKTTVDGAAALLKTQQDLAETSNKMTAMLLTHTDKLTDAMDKFSGFIESTVIPGMDLMLDNLKSVLIAAGVASGVSALADIAQTIAAYKVAKTVLAKQAAATTAGAKAAGAAGAKAAGAPGASLLSRTGSWLSNFITKAAPYARAGTGVGMALTPSTLGQGTQYHEGKITSEYVNLIKDDANLLRQELDANRQKLHDIENDEKYKNLDKKIREKAIDATKENIDILSKLIKEVKTNTDTVRAASTCELDYSSPQALFNSFAKIMIGGKAGITDSMSGTSAAATASSRTGGTGGSYSDIIGHYESSGKYDTVFGQAGGAKINDKLITENTIAEVIEWQKKNRHTNRHAAGKYGFIDVADVAKEAGIAADALFNAETQELMQQAFTRRSARILENLGIEATNENLSLAHSVGPGGAQKLLNAQKSGQGNLIAADVLGLTGAGRATNPQLVKSVSEVLAANTARFSRGTPTSPTAGGTTPSAQQAASMVTSEPPAGGTTPTTSNTPGAPTSSPTLTSGVQDQLQTLNNTMAQLLTTSRESHDLLRKQLSSLHGMSNNAYPV